MKKNTPLLIFTGLAVAAAGTLGAVLTGSYPGATVSQTVVEAPASPVASQPAAPAETQPETQAVTETPAAPVQDNAQPAAAAPVETQVATAPAQDVAPAPITGVANADPNAPSFDTVNVLPSGEAVIAGHAKPGSEVTIKFAGTEVGKAVASADGSFAFVPEKPLPEGAGALTLEATVDGKLMVSQDQIAIVVAKGKPALVAKIEPQAPTKVVQAPSTGLPAKEVQLSAVDYDEQGNIVFQGRVTAGGTVRFYVDNQVVGDTKADDAGNWIFKGSTPIAPGTHTLRADEIDAVGKVLSRAELPFLREEAEKVIAATETEQPAALPVAPAQETAATPDQVQPKSAEPVAPAEVAVQTVTNSNNVVITTTPGKPSRIIIQPGNNLWRISRQVYGKGQMFTVIWEANREQIKNPNRVYPGQILSAPKS